MKINIINYVNEKKATFKQYKNCEKLKVIDVAEKNVNANQYWKEKYVCQNQNGNLVYKTDFALNYHYSKNSKGVYSPLNDKSVLASKVASKIEFHTTEGEACSLVKGDYVVVSGNKIFGMKKEEFEENYKSTYLARKFNSAYELLA